ncbi:MAG: tripartite tricarboxylate transporter TctB family protein [Bauldia sp.]|nr:tripartite tricarboxylate transporter TctB family protein [Bauldia sp.]
MTRNRQDIAAGVLFIALGLLFAFDIWRTGLAIGEARAIGPAFLPAILAGILVALGIAVTVKAFLTRVEPEAKRPIPWRGIAFIAPLPILFGLTIDGAGLVLPIFVVAFLGSFATRDAKPVSSLLVAAGITVFSVVIFHYLAGLPQPLFGPWFDFLRS